MDRRTLVAALDYIPAWLEFQMRLSEQPGCAVAIAHRGRIVLERAFGHANLATGAELTPRHRFRVASHSKSFTAAGVMKLRERGRVRLDDPVGRYLSGLHRGVGEVTIGQLLSHSAGIARDGADCGQWEDERTFLAAGELLHDLSQGPAIVPGTRFKYSNHGYGLLGLALQEITGQPYAAWIDREVIQPAGLTETSPDVPGAPTRARAAGRGSSQSAGRGRSEPAARGRSRASVRSRSAVPMASGHTNKVVLGRRLVIPGDNPTNALAPATGFVSTAADLARFFSLLHPEAKGSFLSTASRLEMTRRHWTCPHSCVERHYGLGIISGRTGEWDWFGHSGGFQGFITRTAVVGGERLAVSVLTNAVDGPAAAWLDGTLSILQGYARHGAPSRRNASWTGRWWTLWSALDLLPMRDRKSTRLNSSHS